MTDVPPQPADPEGVVHVVDDDADMAESLRFFLDAHWIKARTYASAEEFLATSEPEPGCMLLDLRMPGVGGMALLERLAADHRLMPTIVLTAHGDVSSAVQAMKLGAVDFLTKPHDSRQLLTLVKSALARGVEESRTSVQRRRLLHDLETLTPREREIFAGIIAGHSSRQIADQLGLQPKSIEIYRGRVINKLGFVSSLELVGTVLRICPELASEAAPPGSGVSAGERADEN